MKVLITGAGGQVGLELITHLLARGDTVCATDLKERPAAAPADVPWRHLDVTDPAAVHALVQQEQPDSIFHLAAILSATGEQMPNVAYRVNQTGTYNVLEACRQVGVRQLIFTSTIAAFGPGLPDLVPNDVPMRPSTMYGVTKVAGELLGEYYHQKWDLDFRCVRYPGLISAGVPGGGTSDYALHMYTDGIKRGHYESFCHADTRIPLMYMPDAIRALVDLAAAPRERLKRCVYNIAAMSPTAAEIAESVRSAVPDVDLTFCSDPHRQAILDSWPRALDDGVARDEWGWHHEYDLDAMTAHLVPEVRKMIEHGLL